MRYTRKEIISNTLLLSVFLVYLTIYFFYSTGLPLSYRIGFFFNIVIIFLGIFFAKTAISLYKVYLYYALFFLVIAPLSQLLSNYSPWDQPLTSREVNFSNFIIFLFNLFFIFTYNYYVNKNNKKEVRNSKYTRINITRLKLNFLWLFSMLVSIAGIAYLGFEGLFIKSEANLSGGIFSIVLNLLLRSIPATTLAILLILKKKGLIKRKDKTFQLLIILLTITTLLLNNPMGLSRFLVGAVYLGLIVSFLPEKIWGKRNFDIVILVAIFIIFPLFYLFKNFTLLEIISGNVDIVLGNFNSIDFDAFTLIGRTARFVSYNGLQLGQQIKSTIFFFVPRALLDIKGIPSGQLVASSQNFFYTNLSEPIMAEGYIDFGWLGVFVFSYIYAFLLSKVDIAYEELSKRNDGVYYYEIAFVFLLGFVVYLSRGALQPTFLRFMGFSLFLIVIYVVQKFPLKKAYADLKGEKQ